MKLFRLKLKNENHQRFISYIYFGFVLALLYRPDVGTLIPHLIASTNLNTTTITLLFFGLAFFLGRTQPIYLLVYVAALFPLAVFSGYSILFVFTNLESSVVMAVFIAALWYKVIGDLFKAVEAQL